jgi:hypothetical protein
VILNNLTINFSLRIRTQLAYDNIFTTGYSVCALSDYISEN